MNNTNTPYLKQLILEVVGAAGELTEKQIHGLVNLIAEREHAVLAKARENIEKLREDEHVGWSDDMKLGYKVALIDVFTALEEE